MGAGPSRKQESAKSPPAPQLLKAQLKKSPAEEGAGISSKHIKGHASEESADPTQGSLGAHLHIQSAFCTF